ncbi:MAG TPA: cupredoxin family copper-binding protein [Actinocrinis sp.]|nr:cupredoxin family copper-binding protein [Actinocrinis sp.]
MDFIHHAQARRASALAGLLLAAAALTACSGTSGPAPAATGIAAGAGQSLAGMPGSTGTGAAPAASGDPMPSMTMIMTAPGGSGAPAAPVAGDAVAIKNFAFAPAALMVKVGTTVTWTNQDSDNHTVTSQGSGGPLQSAALDTGQSYSYTFTKPGTYSYYCTIHPFMIATVTVTQ